MQPLPDVLVHRVARRIAELRTARGITQDELARRLEIGTKNLQRIESGKQNLTLRTIESIATVLAVDAITLLAPPGSGLPWMRDGGRASLLSALESVGWRSMPAELPRPRGSVPLMTLRAAASPPIPSYEQEVLAWLVPPKDRARVGPAWFVAQVNGASMEPLIPHGALCLFKPVTSNDYVGRILLVQHRAVADLDTGGSYAVKRVASISPKRDGSTVVVLASANHRFRPISFVTEASELRPIAELDRVLWPATEPGHLLTRNATRT